MESLILRYEKVARALQQFKNKNKVLVGGCFDLIHYGHLSFLMEAKKQGDLLIIALESDEHVLRFKKRNPIHSQSERAEILSSMRFVDIVILMPFFKSFDEYEKLVILVQPEVIAVTADDPQTRNKKIQAEKVGGVVVEVSSLLPRFATRKIIANFS
ncbi:glycerol-3-phosphate cytidylyltransferase [Candidatus Roizmanbacteria bacterium CG_4_10_14_0_2_um_filter_36_9]|uniref:Glycerol-3-phosphate cytidylyltransferase n=1 Tax=Candidatus Roizmanbacteria bacterium CG_4_10_14_0_2_um_filter_36_9 TaxID=1974823 RepID=A0A2M7U5M3_9BACT|nr:MAG: glycerol-3-phosphate cytidylyltransferase [Candidatus Roizmanbacteria bacterium CG_4_10_14_0_2_um_filter_36_9]